MRAAQELGISEGRLRGPDLERPFHGVRVPLTPVPANLSEDEAEQLALLARCAAFAPVLRAGQHFSHDTAARLWGCPLPRRFDGAEPLHVSTAAPGRAGERRGIIGHQARNPQLVHRHNFRVSDPASTWLALATHLGRDDLVAVGDHLILDPRQLDPLDLRPYASLAQLAERAADFSGRGARAASSALRLMRVGAESRPETLLRLLLARAGFGEPELQAEIRDRDGSWLGYADLYYRHMKVVVEYDGQHHRTNSVAYDRDMTRIERFIEAGNAVVRVRKYALFAQPASVVTRVQRAFDRDPG